MHKILMTSLMVMFLVNTTLVSAWAKSCVNMHSGAQAQTSNEQVQKNDPPCHEMKNAEEKQTPSKQQKHCKGVCLCFHVSISQTPLLNAAPEILEPIKHAVLRIEYKDVALQSRSPAPLFRPPISHS